MKKDIEDRTTKNGSVHDDNEMFFKELASAYVEQEGKELRGEVLRTIDFPTDNLDRKMKQAMKGGSKAVLARKRRNRTLALGSMAAVFMMFVIYSAIIPTMNRQEQPAGAPEAAMMVEEAADEVSYFARPEEEPVMVEDEMVVADAGDDDWEDGLVVGEVEMEAEPTETGDVARFLASTIVVEHLEASLPDGYRITHQEVHEDRVQLHLYSATNLPILLMEEPEESLSMALHRDAEILEVNGVEVLQNRLSEDEVWLHFQAMDSSFTLVGQEPEELMIVARAILDFPDLSSGQEPGVDGADEIILIPLPRGLFMIVPLP